MTPCNSGNPPLAEPRRWWVAPEAALTRMALCAAFLALAYVTHGWVSVFEFVCCAYWFIDGTYRWGRGS